MIRKRGSVYYTDFQLPSGKRIRQSTGTNDLVQATAMAVALHASLVKDGTPDAIDSGRRSPGMRLDAALKQVYEEHWRHKRNPWKWSQIKTALQFFDPAMALRDITHAVMRNALKAMLDAKYQPASASIYLSTVRTAITYAVDEWDLQLNIPRMPKNKIANTKIRFLNANERVALIYNEADDDLRTLWMFLLDSGVRIGDALRAQWKAFDLNDGMFYNENRKGGQPINLPLQPDTVAELKELQKRSPDVVFGRSYPSLIWAFKKTRDRAGLGKDVTLHTLRHTCATRLLENGADIREVQEWLGHASITMTARYAKVVPSRLIALRDKIAEPQV